MHSQKEFCVALGSRTSLGLLVGGGSGLLKGGRSSYHILLNQQKLSLDFVQNHTTCSEMVPKRS